MGGKTLRKKIAAIALTFTLSFSSVVSAIATYPYGEKEYGAKNISFKGNLEPSGLGVEQRPSNVNRHDLRLHNVNSNTYTPASGYLQTVQYDIQPLPGEPSDKFSEKSGYHVLPLDEELIKDLAEKANGNPEYVWSQVSQHVQKAEASPSMKSGKVEFYRVDYIPYVNIGSVIYYSGGGDPDMKRVREGNGNSSPLFQTTYKTTSWPEILELRQEGQGLKIKAVGHSIFDTMVSGQIIANNESSSAKEVFKKTTPVQNYGVVYEGVVPFSQVNGLKPGENKLTLKVSDAFGRTTPKEITVVVGEIKAPNLVLTKLESSPSSPMKKGRAILTASVKNESDKLLTSPLILEVGGKKVGQQSVTLEPGQEKSYPFSAVMPDANSVKAKATVNPAHNSPKEETTFEDNWKEINIPLANNPTVKNGLNLVLMWHKGQEPSRHAGTSAGSKDTKQASYTYYKNPNTYNATLLVWNHSKQTVTTTVKMENVYKYSTYVVPKPPPCDGECGPPPKPYWSISSDRQTDTKTVTIPANGEVFVTFSGVRPSYTHTTRTDKDGNPVEESFEYPENDTNHELYFILNEQRNPVESTYTDNISTRIVPVNNKGVKEKRGILVK